MTRTEGINDLLPSVFHTNKKQSVLSKMTHQYYNNIHYLIQYIIVTIHTLCQQLTMYQ